MEAQCWWKQAPGCSWSLQLQRQHLSPPSGGLGVTTLHSAHLWCTLDTQINHKSLLICIINDQNLQPRGVVYLSISSCIYITLATPGWEALPLKRISMLWTSITKWNETDCNDGGVLAAFTREACKWIHRLEWAQCTRESALYTETDSPWFDSNGR